MEGNSNRPKLAKYETSQAFQSKCYIYFRYAKTTRAANVWWMVCATTQSAEATNIHIYVNRVLHFAQLVIFFRSFSSLRYFRSLWLICSARAQTLACDSDMVGHLSTCIYVQTIYSLTECLNYKYFGRYYVLLSFPFSVHATQHRLHSFVHRRNAAFVLKVEGIEMETCTWDCYWKALHLPWFLFQYRVTKVLWQRKAALLLYTDSVRSFRIFSSRAFWVLWSSMLYWVRLSETNGKKANQNVKKKKMKTQDLKPACVYLCVME